MATIHTLSSFEQLKLLTDPRRREILQILMSGPATLTMIGKVIGEHPAWVRHHLKQLEAADLVELVETASNPVWLKSFTELVPVVSWCKSSSFRRNESARLLFFQEAMTWLSNCSLISFLIISIYSPSQSEAWMD